MSHHLSVIVRTYTWYRSQTQSNLPRDLRSGHSKDYGIDICCFSTKHAVLRSKSKDWFAQSQNNVSEWSDMWTLELLCSVS
jgi:hypothetical protein